MRSPELAIERLTELRRLGLRVALDDFGTGESRLAHLYQYPLDTLKIDGSVVSGRRANRDHEAVITRRGGARALAPAQGGGGGRRDRGAARSPRALAVRPHAGEPLRPAGHRRRDRAPPAAPAPGDPRAGRGPRARAGAAPALVLADGRGARVSGEDERGGTSSTSPRAARCGASGSARCPSASAAARGSSWCCRPTRSPSCTRRSTRAARTCGCATSAAATAPS